MTTEGEQQPHSEHDQKVYPVMHFNGNCAEALELYKEKLGAEIVCVFKSKKGYVHHACLKMPDDKTWIMCCDDFMLMHNNAKAMPTRLYVQVADVDKIYKEATEAGFTAVKSIYSPSAVPTDMFWGARIVSLQDKYGHEWALAQSIKENMDYHSKEFAEQEKAWDSHYPQVTLLGMFWTRAVAVCESDTFRLTVYNLFMEMATMRWHASRSGRVY
eukprot:TRINITY_DN1726_c0_g1_i2.p1 TRINITY_DN1726_c0_g1~~TRINITY_DN1726_c0_g1_i2.p1  ORF type:complete len:215 (-),score=24.69 TRINITY_DN1726_c0_g1_i2:151-795(-)